MKKIMLVAAVAATLNVPAFALNNDYSTAIANQKYCNIIAENAVDAYRSARYIQMMRAKLAAAGMTPDTYPSVADIFHQEGTANAILRFEGYIDDNGNKIKQGNWNNTNLSIQSIRYGYDKATSAQDAHDYAWGICMDIYGYQTDYFNQPGN